MLSGRRWRRKYCFCFSLMCLFLQVLWKFSASPKHYIRTSTRKAKILTVAVTKKRKEFGPSWSVMVRHQDRAMEFLKRGERAPDQTMELKNLSDQDKQRICDQVSSVQLTYQATPSGGCLLMACTCITSVLAPQDNLTDDVVICKMVQLACSFVSLFALVWISKSCGLRAMLTVWRYGTLPK